jgi:hypothetical protein
MAERDIQIFHFSSVRGSAHAGQVSGQPTGEGMFALVLLGPTVSQT